MSDRGLSAAKKALARQQRAEEAQGRIAAVESQPGFKGLFAVLHRFQKVPLIGWLGRFLRWIFRLYGRVFRRFAYAGDPRRLVPWRAGALGILMLISLVAIPWYGVRNVIPFTVKTIYDVALLATARTGTFYFGDANAIGDVDFDGVWELGACTEIDRCDRETSRVFRMRHSWIISLISLVRHGEGHDPAILSKRFNAELNECQVTYYGFRVRMLRFYPYITEASCVPVLANQ